MAVLKINPPKSRRARLMLGISGVLLLVLAIGGLLFTTHIPPEYSAIRQIYLGPNKGPQQGVYHPGMHLVVPGYERLHLFPTTLQVLDLNDNSSRGGAHINLGPSIRIQTSEGYQVTVDVTVLYRIKDPYVVLTKVGSGRLYETSVVARRADKILRETLGQLNAEDFYSDEVRIAKALEAKAQMQEDLSEWGLEVFDVLIREYVYDQRYQQAIEERKIYDQKVFRSQAEVIVKSREAERNRVLAEGKARITVERERGRSEIRKINAEADNYARKQVAEGELLVALAEAQGTKLENRALTQVGAANMVGLEMAEVMEGVQVIMISTTGANSVNPINLDSLVGGW
jgi:regulator of protease activity HflC (stomatin/prohibitin superfamily)